jgi:hypothetical protein
MTYNHETGRGLMDYADVRQAAEEARALLQSTQDDTGQRPTPAALVRVETLLGRIISATPATTRETLRHVEKSDEWANRDDVEWA